MDEAPGQSPDHPTRSRSRRRILRLIGWNFLILFVLLLLAAGGAEVSLRLSTPFRVNTLPVQMVPGVGLLRQPHAEMRYTNGRDFWQVSRTNSLGFPDREPPGPERAAESCHVTLIGDSFVEALEAPIADKAQVQLEELAAHEAPELDVTTSAFGYGGTGPINQLAFYNAYARRLSPDVVALVMAGNDFRDNSLPLKSWSQGFHPDHPPHLFARRDAAGGWEFVPPASDLEALETHRLARVLDEPDFFIQSTWRRGLTGPEAALRAHSHLADWLWRRLDDEWARRDGSRDLFRARAEWLSRHPRYATFTQGWPARRYQPQLMLEENPPPAYREALDAMRFALEQFRERTERDGAALVILAIYELGWKDDPWLDLLRALAAESGGIPVISQHDHIIATGGEVGDASWAHDYHWSPAGHRWAAEAIWEWMKRNPDVCD